MSISITYSQNFLNLVSSLSVAEQKLIGDFVTSIGASGFAGLPGRNKPSTGVSKKYHDRVALIQYAIAEKLWHYHVGHTSYDQTKNFGDWTSEFVVNYQKKTQSSIHIVDYRSHPPFRLPPPSSLV